MRRAPLQSGDAVDGGAAATATAAAASAAAASARRRSAAASASGGGAADGAGTGSSGGIGSSSSSAGGGGQAAPSPAFVYACIAGWIANSALCVLTNKHVLYYLKFGFPATLAVLHMVSAFASTSLLVHCTADGRRHLPPPGSARPVFYYQLAGIGALFGVVLMLSNSVFMYLSVPSIQMLKVRWRCAACAC